MKALIVVDAQNDFMPGGALAVTDGDKIVPVIKAMRDKFDKVYYTMDSHPRNHCSFAPKGPWPQHCVVGDPGWQIHEDLEVGGGAPNVVEKGGNPDVDSYSGFMDNDKQTKTGLGGILRDAGVTDIYVCGLATDYCVKATALDGITEGFKVFLVRDACRAVNVQPGDEEAAIKEMEAGNVKVVTSAEV